ncbi:MAG: glycosyltransferase family 4 protein [Phycisphaerae bacterium]
MTIGPTATSQSNPATQESASATSERRRLCFVVTVGSTVQSLCRGRFEYFQSRGYDVTVVCAPTSLADDIRARGVELHTAPLTRRISPLSDLRALWNLYRFFRRHSFDLIEVSTPKAALLGCLAGRMAGVGCLLHLLRGLSYQQQSGISGRLLTWSFMISCRLPHHLLSISHFMMEQAVRDGMCSAGAIRVLGDGSSNGIDLTRYRPEDAARRRGIRTDHEIPESATVIGFVGRFTGDKGIGELLTAFTEIARDREDVYLLMVGELEERDRPSDKHVSMLTDHPRIVSTGWQSDTAPFYHAMDLFVLPTHREGFGTVLLEAAASACPIVTTKETGWWHPDESEKTGLFVDVKDATGLAAAMRRLIDQPELRRHMGSAARERVERSYDNHRVWALQEAEFARLIENGTRTSGSQGR